MTYSEVVLVLSSHMVPKDSNVPSGQQIALLEKFISESEEGMLDGDEDNLRLDNGAEMPNESELGFGVSEDQPNMSQYTEEPQQNEALPYEDNNGLEDSVAV